MGNSQAKQDQESELNDQHKHDNEHGAHAEGNHQEYQYTEKDLEYVEQKAEDEAYGEIKIYKIKVEDGQQVENLEELEICTKTKIFDSKEDCRDYHKELQTKKYLLHPNLIKLIKSQAIMNNMAYEYVKHNLKAEIQNRYETKEYFQEQLIDQVMKCLHYLKTQGVTHGDIQPKTILIDNQGNFKLTDVNFLTAGICGYKKHLLGLEIECFLAPELLQKLRRQTIVESEEVNQEKADIFSLGLVALAACTLQNVDCVYDFESYTIKEEELLDLLEVVKNQYSYNLYLLLVSMLNSIEKRINYEDCLHLVDQMSSGHFNLEEYEMKRQQQENEQAHNNSQSPHNHHNYDHHGSHNQHSRKSSQHQQGDASNSSVADDRILDFDPDREARKKTKQQQLKSSQEQGHSNYNSNHHNNNNNSQNPSSSFKHGNGMEESNNYHHQSHNQYNSEQKRNPRSSSQINQFSQSNIPGQQSSDVKSDKFESHQFNHTPQHSNQKLGQSYQHMNHSHQYNSGNINDLDSRVKDALLRSQQVTLKFENSPLRLFRDQLLQDELYVPLDPNFSQSHHNKSRTLDTSQRKNQFLSNSKMNNSNNVSKNFSASKYSQKTNNSTQKLLQNGKWKI